MTKRVWLIPVVIVALAFSGVLGARRISLPTLAHIYDKEFKGKRATAGFVIDGVRCYGTANALRKHVEKVPGMVSLVAYGGRHAVVIQFDPQATTAAEIASAIERPIMTPKGALAFFRVVSYTLK